MELGINGRKRKLETGDEIGVSERKQVKGRKDKRRKKED